MINKYYNIQNYFYYLIIYIISIKIILDKSTIITNSIQVPSYSELASVNPDRYFYATSAPDNIKYCKQSECKSSNLLASCSAGTTSDICYCLTDDNNAAALCPNMSESIGRQISITIKPEDQPWSINKLKNGGAGSENNEAPIDVRNKAPPSCDSFRGFYSGINSSPNVMCEYPSDAIPNNNQIDEITRNIDQQDNQYFVKNYCFTKETQDCPTAFTSCPKALTSSGSSNCKSLYEKYPNTWDTGSVDYCQKLYNSSNGIGDFSKTGCQCIIDTIINPSSSLQKVLTAGNNPHCTWKPCQSETSNNLTLYKNDTTQCNSPKCSDVSNITGKDAFNDSIFSQNIVCAQAQENFWSKYKIYIIIAIAVFIFTSIILFGIIKFHKK